MTRVFTTQAWFLVPLAVLSSSGCMHASAPEPGAAVATTASVAPNVAAVTSSTPPTRAYQKPSDAELHSKLSPLGYQVTQQAATERPFDNPYWNNHEAGIYVDAATGEPLFSSLDKYDSGTGWPSFSRPLDASRLVSRSDDSLGTERTEVRSRDGNSHLGHVFNDGPGPSGQRFCINSAALRFVPVNRLAAEGYGDYLPLFSASATAKK